MTSLITIEDQTVEELLTAAKDAILQRGWIQGDYQSPDGRLCIMGAVLYAANCDPGGTDDPVVNEAVDALRAALPGKKPLWQFNDSPDTTLQDVLNLFDLALDRASA